MFSTLISLLLSGSMSFSGMSFTNVNVDFDDLSLIKVNKIPQEKHDALAPQEMSAQGIIALDLKSHTPLFTKNSMEARPMASLTKLMTAAIILNENHPEEQVRVSENAANTMGSGMNLQSGELIEIRQLLYGLLIESANDAATALAEFNAGNEENFVLKMNKMALELGMNNTYYVNASGLDDQLAYSSARDIAILSAHIIKDPSIRHISGIKSMDITSISGNVHHLENTNKLLGEMGVKGLKTGTTPAAGECLVILSETPEGREIITVILGSQNRFGDARNLLDWIYQSYIWQ